MFGLTVTQTFAPSNTTPWGVPPTVNVPRAAPSLALSLLTVPSLLFAVQILAPSKATPYGWLFLSCRRRRSWELDWLDTSSVARSSADCRPPSSWLVLVLPALVPGLSSHTQRSPAPDTFQSLPFHIGLPPGVRPENNNLREDLNDSKGRNRGTRQATLTTMLLILCRVGRIVKNKARIGGGVRPCQLAINPNYTSSKILP